MIAAFGFRPDGNFAFDFVRESNALPTLDAQEEALVQEAREKIARFGLDHPDQPMGWWIVKCADLPSALEVIYCHFVGDPFTAVHRGKVIDSGGDRPVCLPRPWRPR